MHTDTAVKRKAEAGGNARYHQTAPKRPEKLSVTLGVFRTRSTGA